MKKALLFIAMITAASVMLLDHATIDYRLVSRYVADKYGKDMATVYTEYAPHELTTNRHGTVYVQVVKSISQGKQGKTRGGYILDYNKRVRRGKVVTSYLIYNPYTNYDDDVVAVVDNGMLRG